MVGTTPSPRPSTESAQERLQSTAFFWLDLTSLSVSGTHTHQDLLAWSRGLHLPVIPVSLEDSLPTLGEGGLIHSF